MTLLVTGNLWNVILFVSFGELYHADPLRMSVYIPVPTCINHKGYISFGYNVNRFPISIAGSITIRILLILMFNNYFHASCCAMQWQKALIHWRLIVIVWILHIWYFRIVTCSKINVVGEMVKKVKNVGRMQITNFLKSIISGAIFLCV